MAAITWDDVGERFYETGVDHGVLYQVGSGGTYTDGVAWNGLTAVNESPTGGEPNAQYADNIKYLNLISAEDFEFTIEAFTWPEEFSQNDGSEEVGEGVYLGQQARKPFGFSWRTKVGNDEDGEDHGYKIHLVYGAQASPSDKNYETINETPEAITFSWDCTTTPVPVTDYRPTAHIIVDSRSAPAAKLKELEDTLYGSDGGNGTPTLPLPDAVLAIFED